MTAPALDLALLEFARAYSDLLRHFSDQDCGHRLCAQCVEAGARYRAAQASVADLGAAVAMCGEVGCGRVLVVRAGGQSRLAAFADRRGWALVVRAGGQSRLAAFADRRGWALVVRAGGQPLLAAFADRRDWALRWVTALCPDHRRTP